MSKIADCIAAWWRIVSQGLMSVDHELPQVCRSNPGEKGKYIKIIVALLQVGLRIPKWMSAIGIAALGPCASQRSASRTLAQTSRSDFMTLLSPSGPIQH